MNLMRISEYNQSLLETFFSPFHFTIAVDALLAGSTQSAIWMDNPDSPSIVVLWDFADGVYIRILDKIQIHLKSLFSLFDTEIIPEVEKYDKMPEFVIYLLPESTETEIKAFFRSNWTVSMEKASFYEFPIPKLPLNWTLPKLSPNLEGHFIDRQFFEHNTLQHLKELRVAIEFDWDSIDNFLLHSFGYYIFDRESNALVSWAIVGNLIHSCLEFGIDTVESYQRRGLAQFAVQQMIHYAIQKKMTPHWYCFQKNIASVKLAEKLGFKKIQDFNVFIVKKKD